MNTNGARKPLATGVNKEPLIFCVALISIIFWSTLSLAIGEQNPIAEGKDAGVRLVVQRLEIKKVVFKVFGQKRTSNDAHLHIYVTVKNETETRLIHYSLPFSKIHSSGGLSDNFGNKYDPFTQVILKQEERPFNRTPIYPGQGLNDVLIFERPVNKAEQLILQFPLDSVESKGFITVTIPLKGNIYYGGR